MIILLKLTSQHIKMSAIIVLKIVSMDADSIVIELLDTTERYIGWSVESGGQNVTCSLLYCISDDNRNRQSRKSCHKSDLIKAFPGEMVG